MKADLNIGKNTFEIYPTIMLNCIIDSKSSHKILLEASLRVLSIAIKSGEKGKMLTFKYVEPESPNNDKKS